jgi:hypothetical protein
MGIFNTLYSSLLTTYLSVPSIFADKSGNKQKFPFQWYVYTIHQLTLLGGHLLQNFVMLC